MGRSVIIYGVLVSAPNTKFRLEFFSNLTCDPSGYGEGQAFIGFANVKTNRLGVGIFKFTLPASLPKGWSITSTATDPGGNTSEFSRCVSPKR
jgi:hypothetical protein